MAMQSVKAVFVQLSTPALLTAPPCAAEHDEIMHEFMNTRPDSSASAPPSDAAVQLRTRVRVKVNSLSSTPNAPPVRRNVVAYSTTESRADATLPADTRTPPAAAVQDIMHMGATRTRHASALILQA
eukprot:875099-Pleurochrysis_carterae.AAC.1